MSAFGFDHEDILLAMAPRPVLVLAAERDFFPIEGTRSSVARAERIWKLYGQEQALELFVDDVDHFYSPAMAEQAASFFARHLLDGPAPERTQASVEPVEPARLHATKSGQLRGDYPHMRTVHEENREEAERLALAKRRMNEEDRRRTAQSWLAEKVFGPRQPVEPAWSLTELGMLEGLRLQVVSWRNEAELRGHAVLIRPAASGEGRLPCTVALWESGTSAIEAWLPTIAAICGIGRAVAVVDLSGDGVFEPEPINGFGLRERFGTLHKLTTDLFWLDDSLAALRVFELLRAVEVLGELPGLDTAELRLTARGRYGVYAELVARMEARFADLELDYRLSDLEGWVSSRLYAEPVELPFMIPGMLRYV